MDSKATFLLLEALVYISTKRQGHYEDADGRIDPVQQVDFLDRLRRGVLPVSKRSQDLARDIIPVTQAGDAVIRSKSGLLGRDQGSLGWIVGWAEKGEARVVFALNMDCKEPRHIADRMIVTQACLRDIGKI